METLSVVLATYNEEKNIGDCLASVKGLESEIIIVDGTSTDKTVEIGKKHGAKVHVTTNPPIFHINKQKAIDMAIKDWILQLDADERLTEELRAEIRSILSDRHNKKNGYWIPRKNWYLGRFLMKGGQYPDYTLRLYRNGKGHLPQKDVHEQAHVEGDVGYLTHPLIHIADPSFRRYFMRWNRYTTLMAKNEITSKMRYNPFVGVKYLLILPTWWFLLTYIRHKGIMDSWQGFVFSFFSSLRFPVSYIKSFRY
jgi:glycosyltransferase involved in cell wall biosynthesis